MESIGPNNLNGNLPPRKWYQRGWGKAIIVMLFCFVLLLALLSTALLGILKNFRQSQNIIDNVDGLDRSVLVAKSPARQLAEKTNRPQLGNAQAPLVIVEFSDFQCLISRQEFSIIREITNKYKNDLFFIYRQYPVINDNSLAIAEASLCANEQGKFWQIHDKLFVLTETTVTPEMVRTLAQRSGVDLKKYDDCVNLKKYEAQVVEDAQDAYNLDVRGTPTFFINGNRVEGAVTLAQWEAVIAKAKEITGGN